MQDKIAILGECMLELRGGRAEASLATLPMNLSYGGDTLNTAIYLSRLGIHSEYFTALGDDSMSAWMIEQWQKEGVGCAAVARYPESTPGLYLIETDDTGERSFSYWRDQAPVRNLLNSDDKARHFLSQLEGFGWLYLSGITLALFSSDASSDASGNSFDRLIHAMAEFRAGGGKVIFDGNYRPRLWSSVEAAQQAYQTMYGMADLALPTFEDEQLLFGDANPDITVERLKQADVAEMVLKLGAEGCRVETRTESLLVPAKVVEVVDTTSAGDSFNAGYIAAKLKGESLQNAALAGHTLASTVIQHRGAIIPKASMPA